MPMRSYRVVFFSLAMCSGFEFFINIPFTGCYESGIYMHGDVANLLLWDRF